MKVNLTEGSVTKKMMRFSLPLMAGNLLQQCYNIADTLIVGRFIGADALAAVGSAYTLMTFLTSIILGLCMGSGALFSIRYGERNMELLKRSMAASFILISGITIVLNILVFAGMDGILWFLRVPQEVYEMMREYLFIIFAGIIATFLYNYFACLLRAAGESVIPLVFLAVCALLNVALDFWFVLGFHAGVGGAALATVLSQYVSGIGIAVYTWRRRLNLGILMVQGLVNSFGASCVFVLLADFGGSLDFRGTAPWTVHRTGTDGNPCGGYRVPAYRRRILFCHWFFVFVLWILSGCTQTKYVSGADRHFSGDQSGARLYSVSHCNRSDRNLVVCACGMDTGGFGGMDVLFTYEKEENQLSTVCETIKETNFQLASELSFW